jgi:predicted CoA-substrate-specific enzyme activase
MKESLRIGLDAGSTMTKGVVLRGGKTAARAMTATGHDAVAAAKKVLKEIGAGKSVKCSVTGYGRHLVGKEFGFEVLTEIRAHATGAQMAMPGVRLVVDVGGQDTKVIAIGEDGEVKDFLLNDRCAAGTGRFLELLMETLGMDFEEFDKAASEKGKEASLTNTCAVFAQSEVVGLLARGVHRKAIAKGCVQSIAKRLAADVGRLAGGIKSALFCGGGAEINALVEAVQAATGIRMVVPAEARYIGAIGAAANRKT